jgi:hypothetical protein
MARDFITNILVSEEEISKLLNDLPEDDPTAASDFFARFGFSQLYQNNRFFEALERGHEILQLCAKINPKVYRKMHKGYPFYWMGMAAYRIFDFQSAIYYIDATLSEDLKNIPSDPDTPPRLFLRLEGGDDRQAAKYIVQGAQESIEEYIGFYNDVLGKNDLEFPLLRTDDIRLGLLIPAVSSDKPDIRSLASTFITFFLEFKYRDFQLYLRTEPGSNEPFFIHLFKGCLLFESLLKNNPHRKCTKTKLSKVLQDLSKELGISPKVDIGSANLSQVLQDSINASDSIDAAITITGKIRNTLGHDIGWPELLTRDQYLNGFLLIAISCLHTITTLYR